MSAARREATIQAPLGPAQILDLVRRLWTTPGYSPPTLPSVAIEVHALCRRAARAESRDDLGHVERLVEKDPLLTARVLRVAQSAHFAGVSPIRSIQDATRRLGFRTLGDLFLEAAMQARVFTAHGFEDAMSRLAAHSIATAHGARLLGRYCGVFEDYAYLCGLLHDVGIAAALIALGEPSVVQSVLGRTPSLESAMPAIVACHGEAAELVGKAWRLPVDVTFVLAGHHSVSVRGVQNAVTSTICVAESLAERCGFGGFAPSDPAVVEDARNVLQLTKATVDRVGDEVQRTMAARGGG